MRLLIGNTIGSGILCNLGEVAGRLPSMEYFATTRVIDFFEMNKKGPLKAWAD